MPALTLRFLDASRKPLNDQLDVEVTRVRNNERVVRVRGHDGRRRLNVKDLAGGETYIVRSFPMRHRPVSRFVMTSPGNRTAEVDLCSPIDPQRVAEVRFPDYGKLDAALRAVLERSTLERDAGAAAAPPAANKSPGAALYASLTRMERAGLLNVFCKMRHTPLGDVTTWAYVTDLYRVRGDRIFANVQLEFRDRVKNAVAGGGFVEVDGSLHTPPPGYCAAGSFKSRDHYGNLQLTFFASLTAPLTFRLDADIDDAGGIEHAFQVIDHWITGDETHPYDIHQILSFHQQLEVGYTLIA